MKSISNIEHYYDFLLRADGSYELGKGHLMRCKSLLEEFQKKNQKAALVTVGNDISRNIFANSKDIIYIDQDDRLNVGQWPAARYYIVDLYEYREQLYQQIKNKGSEKIFIFDDIISNLPAVDGVINHNIYANDSSYPDHFLKFCGAKYFLLRKELMEQGKGPTCGGENVFICMGGSDPEKQTLRIVKLVRQCSRRIIDVVLGESDGIIETSCSAIEGVNVHVQPQNIQDIMKSAKYAVSGAGTMAYELAFFGVPSVLIVLADNQQRIAEAFYDKEVGINAGFFKAASDGKIILSIAKMDSDLKHTEKLSQECLNLIDGEGAIRLADDLINLIQDPLIQS